MPYSEQERKPSISDFISDDPAKRQAARLYFTPLPFVDEQTGNCQRCADHPPMRLYMRKHPVTEGQPYASRIAEVCPVCYRVPVTGAAWLSKERTKAILLSLPDVRRYLKEQGL